MKKRYLREKDLLAVPFSKSTGICVMKRQTYLKVYVHLREKMEGIYAYKRRIESTPFFKICMGKIKLIIRP